jgi:hypothetical protein
VLITHDAAIADCAERVVTVRDGLLADDVRRRSAARDLIDLMANAPCSVEVNKKPGPVVSRSVVVRG